MSAEIGTEIGLAQRALNLSSGYYTESASHIDAVVEAGQEMLTEIEAAVSGISTYLGKTTETFLAGRKGRHSAEEAIEVLTTFTIGGEEIVQAHNHIEESHRSSRQSNEKRTEAIQCGESVSNNLKNTINWAGQYFTSNDGAREQAYLGSSRINEALMILDNLQLGGRQALAAARPAANMLSHAEVADEKASHYKINLDHARDQLFVAYEDDRPGDLQDIPELKGLVERLDKSLGLLNEAGGKRFEEWSEILQAARAKVSEGDVIYLQELAKRVHSGINAHGSCKTDHIGVKQALADAVEAGNTFMGDLR